MFAVDTPTRSLPFTAKTTLQALLKSRERSAANKKHSNTEASKSSQFLVADDSFATEAKEHEANRFAVPLAENSDRNIDQNDQNGDFSYSQKLFHIADGNLYSIFSPLQGRSYGMKPSFLRKQRCTVQECHGRGRKALRKGLKFHNFLPSESVTSEKDNSYLQDQWKVHSECKLREEHGTKQIMVSNWFQNIKPKTDESSRTEGIQSTNELVVDDGHEEIQSCVSDDKIFEGAIAEYLEHESTYAQVDNICEEKTPVLLRHESAYLKMENTSKDASSEKNLNSLDCSSRTIVPYSQGSKHSFLNNLLHSVSNAQQSKRENSSFCHTTSNAYKHRRKPNQTRRVVPYTKYLSILEENETCPLDLSLKDRTFCNTSSANTDTNSQEIANSEIRYCKSFYNLDSKLESVASCEKSIENAVTKKSHDSSNNNDFVISRFPDMQTYFPVSQPNNLNTQKHHRIVHERGVSNAKVHHTNPGLFHFKQMPSVMKEKVPNLKHESKSKSGHSYATQSVPTISSIAAKISSKPRRKSQRSVIKQKLEDTFRQNGFLVKTKQVSDGEATFCKFRQLRKYTRYYLKSWQQHLPDEVHKMWKGFLPPKTVLPPIASNAQNSAKGPTQ